MQFISDPSLPGHGRITGVFFNRNQSICAITSAFHLLINPPARASYGGQRLRYRVALYHPPETKPFAVFDQLRYPVNDVAFHPTEPTAAIATGSYDGGWMFDGELIVWNSETGQHSTVIGPIPEVVRCVFSSDGSHIIAFVRPWTEESPEHLDDPFDSFYEVLASYEAEIFEGVFNKESIAQQISAQHPKSSADMASDSRLPVRVEDPEDAVRRAFKLETIRTRPAVWDVAWLDIDRIGLVHDDCQLEVLGPDGTTKQEIRGTSYGSEILKAEQFLVHAVLIKESAEGWLERLGSQILKYDGSTLTEKVFFEGDFAFSISRDGRILGRRSRGYEDKTGQLDVLGTSDLDRWSRHDFGHYDVFNHFLRVDGSPYLFSLQGTPPGSHERKYLCTIGPDGSLNRLWPVSPDRSHHAMDCAGAYVADSHGESLILSGRYHNPNPSRAYSGFICRRGLETGKEIWCHQTRANATAIKSIPSRDIIVVTFLNGEIAAIESTSGKILQWSEFRPDGQLSVIFSFDVSDQKIVIGTMDGRVGIIPIKDFMTSGMN